MTHEGKEWVETRLFPPEGPGQVVAFSKPAQKEMRVNWKYVAQHPDIYTSWRKLEAHERA